MMGQPLAANTCLVVVATALAASCAVDQGKEDMPTIREIRSAHPTLYRSVKSSRRVAPGPIMSLERIDLPLNAPTDDGWKLIDEATFGQLTRRLWNTNGLRMGLLPAHKWHEFIDALPPMLSRQSSRLAGIEHLVTIRRAPRLRHSTIIDATAPPAPRKSQSITGGRLQLLAQLTHDRWGRRRLYLVPHHHVPKLVLVPRDPLEKELDGRMFEDLAVRAEIPQDQLLVIGLYRPWLIPPKDAPRRPEIRPHKPTAGHSLGDDLSGAGWIALGDESADRTPVLQPVWPDLEPPALSNNLGLALLTSQRFYHRIQMIMVISLRAGGS